MENACVCVCVREGGKKEGEEKRVRKGDGNERKEGKNNMHPSCFSLWAVYQVEGVKVSGFFSPGPLLFSPFLLSSLFHLSSPSSTLLSSLLLFSPLLFEHWHQLITCSADGGGRGGGG